MSPPSKKDNPAAFRADVSRIIKYAPAELIGREAETKLLADAWDKVVRGEGKRPHVLTFIALGGEGKTSLVAKWAAELAHQDWPGCAAAYAWSFYSQGTREQMAASSDVFLKEALTFFGDPAMAGSAQGAFDKGRRLAQLVGKRRALLILDGLEPLQYAPTSPTPGELKDQGTAALLKGLAAINHGLCVVTTRYSIPDLRAYWQTTAPEEKLLRLSREAGVALLRSLGVKGALKEFETLVEDVQGHALTLNLLGAYLHDAHAGDIRKRDLVKLEEADAEEQGGHAFRVMDAYVRWLEGAPLTRPSGTPSPRGRASTPTLLSPRGRGQGEGERERPALALLRLVGLFDRPMTADCLAALQKAPAIPGLTEALAGMGEAERNVALARLEAARLLTVHRDAAGALLSLDAHPLLREYFGRKLRRQHPHAWRAAHRRLYEHLCVATKDKPQPTLEDLQPLYQAVTHGCQAGMEQEACAKVYCNRILRGTGIDGFYSMKKLGVVGSDLGAIACFFEEPWRRVSPALRSDYQAWLLNEAALRLRALGRLTEALEPMRAGLEMGVKQKNWKEAAIRANNLSELELTLGEVDKAVDDAGESVTYADRSGDAFQRMARRTTHACALHQAGRWAEAEACFREAEAMQAESQPAYPLLYSVGGFQYCGLLLAAPERAAWQCRERPLTLPSSAREEGCRSGSSPGRGVGGEGATSSTAQDRRRSGDGARAPRIQSCYAVSQRAAQTLKIAEMNNWLLDIALDHLTLGRAVLYEAILAGSSLDPCRVSLQDAVDGLHRAGQQHYLPLGLLTRAWLRSLTDACTGPESAQSDLDEAWEIAERGPMLLFLADIHLHRARLFSREKPYPWQSPQADLAEAWRLIEKHGYGRRKEELEDAEAAAKSWPDTTSSMRERKSTMHKTVVELDLVGYSTICDNLEQGLDVNTIAQLNRQIQSFIDAGLKAVCVSREQTVMSTTGDGAILVFDSAQDAHQFAEAVHTATAEHNRTRKPPLTKRVFRSGAATGEIVIQPKPGGGFDIAGTTIARAVRLEAKAQPGGLLVDEATYQDLSAKQKSLYGPKTHVTGKRDEEFPAFRCLLNPTGPEDAALFTQQVKKENASASSAATALDTWRKKLAFLLAEEAKTADAEQKFSIQQRIEEAQAKIRELGGR